MTGAAKSCAPNSNAAGKSPHSPETRAPNEASKKAVAGGGSGDADGGLKSPSSSNKALNGPASKPIDPGMFITPHKARLTDRYIRERKLGSGAYGEVLLCRDRQSGAERAVKVIQKTEL